MAEEAKAEVAKAEVAKAEAAKPSGESEGAEVKTQKLTEKVLTGPLRRDPRSVVKVSQLLLRAISEHKGLTLATLKKELGHAGYQVRRKCCRHSSEAPKSNTKGTLISVSGSSAAGYFRVWKTPKPKRKPGRPKLEEVWTMKRTPAGARRSRGPRKRRMRRRRAAKKAREIWRRRVRAKTTVRRVRPRAKDPAPSGAKEETRAKVMDQEKGRTIKGDRPRTQEEKRTGEEKKQDPAEKPVKRTNQKLSSVKNDKRAAGAKISTKS